MTATVAYARAARYFRPDLGKIIFSTLLVGVTTLSTLAQPFAWAILIDVVLMGKRVSLPWPHRIFLHIAPSGTVGQIILLAVITAGLRICQEMLGLWQAYYKIVVSYNGLLRV